MSEHTLYDRLESLTAGMDFERVELQDVLLRAISQMRHLEQRDLITAYYREGATDDQLAKRFGKSVAAIQTQRHRALRRLRKILRQNGER